MPCYNNIYALTVAWIDMSVNTYMFIIKYQYVNISKFIVTTKAKHVACTDRIKQRVSRKTYS